MKESVGGLEDETRNFEAEVAEIKLQTEEEISTIKEEDSQTTIKIMRRIRTTTAIIIIIRDNKDKE